MRQLMNISMFTIFNREPFCCCRELVGLFTVCCIFSSDSVARVPGRCHPFERKTGRTNSGRTSTHTNYLFTCENWKKNSEIDILGECSLHLLPKGPNPQTDLTLRLESLWVSSLNAMNPGAFVVPFCSLKWAWNNGWVECSSIFLLIKLIFFFLVSNFKSVHDPRSFAHSMFLAIKSYCRFWGHWWRHLSWVAMDWQ